MTGYLSTQTMNDLLQNLKFYNTAANYFVNFTDEVKAYLSTLPDPEFTLKIDAGNNLYGSIMKYDDTVYICLYGVNANMYTIIDCLFIGLPWNFYGIESGVSETISRYYISVHHQLQSLLITYPSIKKIRIIGDSYGGAMSQVLAVILHKLLLYAKGTITNTGRNFIDTIYSLYLSPYLSSIIGQQKQDPIFNQVNSQMLLNPDSPFIDIVKGMDRTLFSNVDLEQVFIFGAPNSLDVSILDDPDLNMQASIQTFDSGGTPPQTDFFSRIYALMSVNDPVANTFSIKTPQGVLVYLFNRFRQRIIIGQMCCFPGNIPMHGSGEYTIALYNAIKNGDQIAMYSYNTVPNPYLFSLTRFALFGLRVIGSNLTPINVLVVIIAVLAGIIIEIVIPLLACYGIYLLVMQLWSKYH